MVLMHTNGHTFDFYPKTKRSLSLIRNSLKLLICFIFFTPLITKVKSTATLLRQSFSTVKNVFLWGANIGKSLKICTF